MGKIKGTGFSSKAPMTTKADERYVYPIDKFVMDDNLIEGAKKLISYYRQFPHIFVEEYFGIKLYDFQKIALYEMMHTNYFVFTATRNCGKQ